MFKSNGIFHKNVFCEWNVIKNPFQLQQAAKILLYT